MSLVVSEEITTGMLNMFGKMDLKFGKCKSARHVGIPGLLVYWFADLSQKNVYCHFAMSRMNSVYIPTYLVKAFHGHRCR